MEAVKHLTTAELEAGLDEIRQSPKDDGVLEMIVRRPTTDEREVLTDGELSFEEGLVGDNWRNRGHCAAPGGATHAHEHRAPPPWSPRTRSDGRWRATNSLWTWT